MSWQRLISQAIPYAAATGLLVGLQQSPLVETANLLVYDLAINLRNRSNDGQSTEELKDLAYFGINPAQSRALGGITTLGWCMAPNLQLNWRAAGQVAFNQLTNDMGFSLGSDVGLKGLPGTLISGDTGWLSSAELNWAFWQQQNNTLQLVPFFGIGGIQTTRDTVSFNDTIGSGGILLRWLHGRHWSLELGWTEQFNDNDNIGV